MIIEKEKRMVSDTDYEILHAVKLGNEEIIVAENSNFGYDERYLVANFIDNGIIGEYKNCMVGNYLEIMPIFTERLNIQIDKLSDKLNKTNYQTKLFTINECYPNDYKESILNKIVAVKSSSLKPEYCRGDVQLIYVTGGSGAEANSRGSAVFCYHLNNSEKTRFERYDILGEVKKEYLPQWATERLKIIKTDIEKKEKLRSER